MVKGRQGLQLMKKAFTVALLIYFKIDIFVFLRSQVSKFLIEDRVCSFTVALFVNFKIDILVFLSGQGKTGFAVDEKSIYGCTFDLFQN